MPTVRWYDELGNLIANGTTLIRGNVQATGRNPTFICIVSSDAGMAQELVMLTVYGKLKEGLIQCRLLCNNYFLVDWFR